MYENSSQKILQKLRNENIKKLLYLMILILKLMNKANSYQSTAWVVQKWAVVSLG